MRLNAAERTPTRATLIEKLKDWQDQASRPKIRYIAKPLGRSVDRRSAIDGDRLLYGR